MEALLVGAAGGLGVLLIYDALTRPDARPDIRRLAGRLGPRGAGAVAGAASALALTGWPMAGVACGILGWTIPSMVAAAAEEKQRLARMEAIADLAARLRDSIRAGIGIQDALSQTAANPPAVLAPQLRRLVSDARVSGLEVAAASFSQRLGPDAETLAAALSLAERLGSRNISDVLDNLAEATAGKASTLREARARQTRARLSARVVAAVPLVLLIGIRFTNRPYLQPFSSPGGQLVLGAGLGLIALGYAAMLRMARLEGGQQ